MLKAVVDDVGAVPEALREMYKPVGEGELAGKFMLQVEPAAGLELGEVASLRAQYGETAAKAKDLQQALDSYKGIKEKPSELAKKLARLAELEAIDPDSEADKRAALKVQSREEALAKEYDGKLSERDATIEQLRGSVEKFMRTDTARAAAAKYGGDADLLEPFILQRTRVSYDGDGTPKVEVLDQKGGIEYAVRGGKVEPATVEDLVIQMRGDPRFGRLFDASGTTGTGAKPANGGASNAKTIQRGAFEQLPAAQQMEMAKSGVQVVD